MCSSDLARAFQGGAFERLRTQQGHTASWPEDSAIPLDGISTLRLLVNDQLHAMIGEGQTVVHENLQAFAFMHLFADPRRLLPGTYEDRHIEVRSEEHTSELQSRRTFVCRLLLENTNANASSSVMIDA